MKNKFKTIIIYSFIILWACLWMRNFYKDIHSHLEETKKLCGKPLEEKWEYVFGEDLYKLFIAAKELLPQNAKISFIHKLDRYKSIRADYFLYPRTRSEDADYIMVYKHPFVKDSKGEVIYAQGSDIFIIKM